MLCPNCGTEFTPKRSDSRFCSYRCRKANASRMFYKHYPERVNAQNKRWRKENAERYKANARAYHLKNRDRHLENCKRNYRANKERYRIDSRRWAKANHYKVMDRQRRRRARKKGSPEIVVITQSEWLILCYVWNYRCAYCNRRRKLTQDHAIPLSRGGAHTFDNIVPACVSCNSQKGTLTSEEYRESLNA